MKTAKLDGTEDELKAEDIEGSKPALEKGSFELEFMFELV